MTACYECGSTFIHHSYRRMYCSDVCQKRRNARRKLEKYHNGVLSPRPFHERRCENCQLVMITKDQFKKYCSLKCKIVLREMRATAVRLEKNAAKGTINLDRLHRWRGRWTPEELAALRADPFCVLPNRTLRAQWRKCHTLGIPRDDSLTARYRPSKETERRLAARKTPEYRRKAWHRGHFRRRVRADPEPFLAELRQLARGHQHAEDLVIEGFATMLRDCVPAAEAFKLAKAEVNRTSAQPFKEQSFNPDIDYAARETGRQVARASDLRAARREG